MESDFKVYWTDEAINNLESILYYIKNKWTQRELDQFKIKLGRLIKLIEVNPELFPLSKYNRLLRKAVLSKQTTIFYKLSGKIIYLVYLFNNKQNINRIK